MRATVEHQENLPSLTPVEVIVVLGKEDLTIKVTILYLSFEYLLREFKKSPINQRYGNRSKQIPGDFSRQEGHFYRDEGTLFWTCGSDDSFVCLRFQTEEAAFPWGSLTASLVIPTPPHQHLWWITPGMLLW